MLASFSNLIKLTHPTLHLFHLLLILWIHLCRIFMGKQVLEGKMWTFLCPRPNVIDFSPFSLTVTSAKLTASMGFLKLFFHCQLLFSYFLYYLDLGYLDRKVAKHKWYIELRLPFNESHRPLVQSFPMILLLIMFLITSS